MTMCMLSASIEVVYSPGRNVVGIKNIITKQSKYQDRKTVVESLSCLDSYFLSL